MPTPGFYALIAALAAGQLICWAALFYAFSSLVLPMQRTLGWSAPQLMAAFTIGLAVWGAASYGVGVAIDRGRGRLVLSGGSLLAGIGFLLWSQVQTLAALYLAWAVMGMAMAMTLYEPAFNIITKRFPQRFRQGIMALTLVGGFASTLSFPAVAWLVVRLDWRGALVAIGLLLLFFVTPLHAWALRAAPLAPTPPRRPEAVADATVGQALRERRFWCLTTAFALHSFCVAAVFAHLMPALAEKSLSQAEALTVAVCFGPAQVLSRFCLASFGSGRTSRRFALGVMAGVPAALAVFAVSDRTPGLIVFSIIFGLSNGLATIVRGSLVPDYFGREHVGRISGAMSALALLARAAAPFAAAWLLLPLHSYQGVLWSLCLLGIVGVTAYAAAGPPSRQHLH